MPVTSCYIFHHPCLLNALVVYVTEKPLAMWQTLFLGAQLTNATIWEQLTLCSSLSQLPGELHTLPLV